MRCREISIATGSPQHVVTEYKNTFAPLAEYTTFHFSITSQGSMEYCVVTIDKKYIFKWHFNRKNLW